MKILRTRVSHEIYYYLYYDLTMICHNKKNSKKKKKLELGFSFQLFHFIAYSQLIPCPLILHPVIHHKYKNNKIPALSNKLMEAVYGEANSNRSKLEGQTGRKWIRREGKKRVGVVGRELINDVGRRVEWLDFSFHGEHDFWREFRTSLKGSKLVRIQFTGPGVLPSPRLPSPLPDPDDLSIRGKIGKTNLFPWKIFFNVSASLFFFFSFSFPHQFLSKKKREREGGGGENHARKIDVTSGGDSFRKSNRRRPLWRRLITRDRSSLAARDIFQVRWVRKRPGKTVFVASLFITRRQKPGEFGIRDVTWIG